MGWAIFIGERSGRLSAIGMLPGAWVYSVEQQG